MCLVDSLLPISKGEALSIAQIRVVFIIIARIRRFVIVVCLFFLFLALKCIL